MDTINIMYEVIKIMSKMKLPVVFKGAMVLKHVMLTEGIVNTYRLTGDIDIDWVRGKVTTEEIIKRIREAISNLGIEGLTVKCTREPDTKKSAGFVVNYQGRKLFSFDVSIKENPFYAEYMTKEGITFTGASIEKMYADKMCAISSKLVFRRVKDIYDLYLLSFLEGYSIKNILEICNYQNKEIGKFEEYIYRLPDLVYAYDKLDNVVNKPSFEAVYSRVRDFCMPFISSDYKYYNGMWSPVAGQWYQV